MSPRERIEAPETALLLADARGASDQTGRLMSFFSGGIDPEKYPGFFLPDLKTYIAQDQYEAAQLEPKRFERIMKKMLKKPKGGRP